MSEPEPATMVVPCRIPRLLVERIERAAVQRQVNRQVVVREALEVYLALCEHGLRVVQTTPGGFHDTAGKGGG